MGGLCRGFEPEAGIGEGGQTDTAEDSLTSAEQNRQYGDVQQLNRPPNTLPLFWCINSVPVEYYSFVLLLQARNLGRLSVIQAR
jgi:hypothetical protein